MAKIRTLDAARAWRTAQDADRTALTDKLARIKTALADMTGIPTLSKLTAFLAAIKEILEVS